MIEIRNKQILIDGRPRLLICGEIHYFRLPRGEWQDRITKLKRAGCNGVASYVPWLCHEPVEGQVDLDGTTRPELDLPGFIDLCRDNDLYFLVRPGPFIMAEMKNEGLPYWLYARHPEIVPVSWDGQPVPTRTVDYLAPAFLEQARRWYRHVMPPIAARLHGRGGNIIGVQLDNEIGMLSWVSNRPDLTDQLLADFVVWLRARYDLHALQERYPFALEDGGERNNGFRSPREEYAVELMRDLGYYMRHRFARYVTLLRSYAEENGVTGVPFVVNIHGTSDGRGLTYPIGISQLYEAYTQAPGYVAGSDHYLGDLTLHNFQDLYLANAFMEAVQRPEQPLTSVEFECGSGDYGSTHGQRNDPSSVQHKTRMCIAQGNRLLNYYLFTGGFNYRLDQPPNDGNDRIAFTGERHGFAAPVSPEGALDYSFHALADVVRTVLANEDKLAAMHEEHDNVAFAFIPDYFMTESRYPASVRMKEIIANLEANRGPSAWDIIARAMLLGSYRFGAIDIQNRDLNPRTDPVLVVASARYLDMAVQRKLVEFLEGGGRILIYGEVPLADMEGRPCSLLADALGLTPIGTHQARAHYYLSLEAQNWAAPRPEVRTHFAQVFTPTRGEVLLSVYGTGEACGFDIDVGQGRAIVLATAYPCDIDLFRTALERLGAVAALRHDCAMHGIFMTTTASDSGERFLHLLNLDGFDKTLRISEYGAPLLDSYSIVLRGREGLMLPLNITYGDVRIVYSTAEVLRVAEDEMEFRLTQAQELVSLETDRNIQLSEEYSVEQHGRAVQIRSHKHALLEGRLVVRWTADQR
jgi:beta-galactosidase